VLRDLGITLIAADSLSSVLDDGPTSKLIRQTLGAVSEFDKAMTVAKLKGARDGVRRTNEMRRAKELRRALLSSIVIAWAAGFGGVDALAVDDRRRGAGVAPGPFAICHYERMV
jgi:hypothetical protein